MKIREGINNNLNGTEHLLYSFIKSLEKVTVFEVN